MSTRRTILYIAQAANSAAAGYLQESQTCEFFDNDNREKSSTMTTNGPENMVQQHSPSSIDIIGVGAHPDNDLDDPRHPNRPSNYFASSSQKVRKRVAWRGKVCIVALPPPDSDTKPRARNFLAPQEVAERLDQWKDRGFDVRGFRLSSREGDKANPYVSAGQTRPQFPDPEEIRLERMKRSYHVNIPDLSRWETYVGQLKEEKLQALLLSFGGDCDNRDSPVVFPMAHLSPSQIPNPTMSPFTHPSSSSDGLIPQPLHGILPGASNNSTMSAQSSPALSNELQQHTKHNVSHFPRYSLALPGHQLGSLPPYQLLQPEWPSPNLRPYESHTKSQSNSRHTSPALNASSQFSNSSISLRTATSPKAVKRRSSQSADDPIFASSEPQPGPQVQEAPRQKYSDGLQVLSSSPIQVASEHTIVGSRPALAEASTTVLNPIPRGVNINLSKALQNEAEHSKFTSKAFTEQSMEDNHALQRDIENNAADRCCDAQEAKISDFARSSHATGNLQSCVGQQQQSSSFMSTLNANAPEFRLPSTLPAAADIFAFNGVTNPSSASNTVMRPTAPSFTPGVRLESSLLSPEFTFTSSNFAHQSFEPTGKVNRLGFTESKLSDLNHTKIFDNTTSINDANTAKKSRAVPIITPANNQAWNSPDVEGQEDESGRVTRADGRQKRARRSGQHVDQIPRFAKVPSTDEITKIRENGPPFESVEHDHRQKNNTSLEKAAEAANQLQEIINELSASDESALGNSKTEQMDGIPWGPFPFQDDGEAIAFNAALPRPHSPDSKDGGSSDTTGSNSENLETTAHEYGSGPAIQEFPNLGTVNTDTTFFDEKLVRPLQSQHDPSSSVSEKPLARTQRQDISVIHPTDKLERCRAVQVALFKSTEQSPERAPDLIENVVNGVTYIEPFQQRPTPTVEQRNDQDSATDLRLNRILKQQSRISDIDMHHLHKHTRLHRKDISTHNRSDAPSPSKACLPLQINNNQASADSESARSSLIDMVARNARFSPSYRPSRSSGVNEAPADGLGRFEPAFISDWNDTFSSGDEDRFSSRQIFFDARIDEVVGKVVQKRLDPLKRTLDAIQGSLTNSFDPLNSQTNQPKSGNAGNSDADDEDDVGGSGLRMTSPLRDRKYDRLKASIAEIAIAQQDFVRVSEISSISDAVKDIKASLQPTAPSSVEIKTIVEEAVGRQMRGRSGPITSSHQSATVEKNQLQITGLESMLKIAEDRAEDEIKARRATEDALADSQRLLRVALQDAAEQRESAEETERSLSDFHDERHQVLRQLAMLEGAQESQQRRSSELSEKNAALESTLEEYRLSSAQWRKEIECAKAENNELRLTITALRAEIEDNLIGRQALRAKFDQLQEDMTLASHKVAHDQSLWRAQENEYKASCDSLNANLDAEIQKCEKLKLEVENLREKLRSDNDTHKRAVAEYERNFHSQREVARLEKDRMQLSTAASTEAAEAELNQVRTELGNTINNLKNQLSQSKSDAIATKAHFEHMADEVAKSKEAALEERQSIHSLLVEGLKAQHEQEIQHRSHEENHLKRQYGESTAMANEKVMHYLDKIHLLEEKLEIAKTAAQAAAQAAHSKQAVSGPQGIQNISNISSDISGKISPQALRESIMVLQEQLQDRESRIERLEQELAQINFDASSRAKDRDTEVVWLRELLDVRTDDLEDIISALSQPSYDREAVRDAAIRLKANLQMEQQEKQRTLAGSHVLTKMSNFTTSPRALPLAAAAAWGNWRKGFDAPLSSLSAITSRSAIQTPSRPSPSGQSFSSGLMTPPNTDIRRTPVSNVSSKGPRHDPSTTEVTVPYSNSRQTVSERAGSSSPPMTPSLTRRSNYDGDASSAYIGGMGDHEEGEGKEEPFGSNLAAFPWRG